MAWRPSRLDKLRFSIRKRKEQSTTPSKRRMKAHGVHRAEPTGQRGLDPEDQLGHTHQGWRQMKGQDTNNSRTSIHWLLGLNRSLAAVERRAHWCSSLSCQQSPGVRLENPFKRSVWVPSEHHLGLWKYLCRPTGLNLWHFHQVRPIKRLISLWHVLSGFSFANAVSAWWLWISSPN